MATPKPSENPTSVTVEWGDTLYGIARDYTGNGNNYTQLATINGISNPNLIYVGQIIKLTNEDGSGGSGSSSASDNSNKPTVTMGLQSNADNILFATWKWKFYNKYTESYKILWTYDTGDGVWFTGNSSSISVDEDMPEASMQSTYNIPNNAKQIKFKVKPISETYKVNDVDTDRWKADWSDEAIYTVEGYCVLGDAPSTPTVEIDKFKLTASLDGIDIENATHIEFEVIKDNKTVFATNKAEIFTAHASCQFDINAGSEYKVRCRAYNSSTKGYSEWSSYSSNYGTIPSTPKGITNLRTTDKTAVYIAWSSVANATGYGIEYATKKIYFDSSSEVSNITISDNTNCYYTVTGLAEGEEYFFRVRAVNDEGESGWCEPRSIVVGRKPAAPTTWSSTTTAIIGKDGNDQVILYWVHNSEDGSQLTYSDLILTISGVELPSISLKANEAKDNAYITYTPLTEDELEQGKTNCCILKSNIAEITDGAEVKWKVRTAGITKEFGDWSIQRTIKFYATPTLQLRLTDAGNNDITTLSSFPFYIKGLAGPKSDLQSPIGYHVSIKSNEIYETVDRVGNPIYVNANEEVYSKYLDIDTDLELKLSAGDIDLENNVEYTITCLVSMSSGLTAESSIVFSVVWADQQYLPNAAVGLDTDTMTTNIRPYCEDSRIVYYQATVDSVTCRKTNTKLDIRTVYGGRIMPYITTTTGETVFSGMTTDNKTVYYCHVDGAQFYNKVTFDSVSYSKTTTELGYICGTDVPNAKTTTGERVYFGTTADGADVYYCVVTETTPVLDVLLSVYRREFDGSFTELASGLDSAKATTVVDPHPALDFARYRIVATTKSTGAVSYYDLPGYPVNCKSVIIQWDEAWSWFETSEETAMKQPPWTGSMLKIPYNIDVTENHSPDVSLVEYTGRSHPVSYYGTQLGSSATWSMEIPKEDKETLYAFRRLARWMGDVYVREPSGSGYWANITFPIAQKHCELTIPISLNITQVEGGI